MTEPVIKLPVSKFFQMDIREWRLHDKEKYLCTAMNAEIANAIFSMLNSYGRMREALGRAVADELGDNWKPAAIAALEQAQIKEGE